jgi:hypothetical protein
MSSMSQGRKDAGVGRFTTLCVVRQATAIRDERHSLAQSPSALTPDPSRPATLSTVQGWGMTKLRAGGNCGDW